MEGEKENVRSVGKKKKENTSRTRGWVGGWLLKVRGGGEGAIKKRVAGRVTTREGEVKKEEEGGGSGGREDKSKKIHSAFLCLTVPAVDPQLSPPLLPSKMTID